MLLTKFHIPSTGDNVVHRSELFSKLNKGLHCKLVLVSAPAGYGKSTLISDWINKYKIPAVWYSIDKRDNDMIEFMSSIIRCTQTLNKDIGVHSLEALKSQQESDIEIILESFINDLLKINQDIFLVLDDFHLIENQEIIQMIAFLLEHAPNKLHLLISTRSDPAFPIARLRSQNELLELRSSELNFTLNDIITLFNKNLKLGLTIDDIHLLESKTEGWIAGLQLAALTIQGRDDISDYLKKFAGDNRYIMDYLMEEVLLNQPEEIKKFLLKTSLLEKLSAPLCNSILHIENSQQLLESLEKKNMFIIPLDNEKKWFRYHHLFADLLNQHLFHQYKNELTEIHLKASIWFEQNQFIYEAIEHALTADNIDRAMNLLNDNIENHWISGDHSAILQFGKQLPEQKIIANTKFCIFYTWMLITAGEIIMGERYLNETEKIFIKSSKDDDEHKDTLGKLSLTYALLYALLGKKQKIIKYAEQAIANLSDKNPLWNGWAYVTFGDAYLMNANLAESEKSYSLAIDNAKKANNQYLHITAKFKLALCLGRHGKYKASAKICKEQLDYINAQEKNQIIYEHSLAGLYSLYGSIQLEWNKLDIALEYTEKGIELAKKANDISLKVFSYVVLINLYFSTGKLTKATRLISDLESDEAFKQTTQWLSIHLTAWKAELLLYNGKIDEASELLSAFKENINEEINKKPEFIQIRIVKLHIIQRKIQDALKLLYNLDKLANDYEKYYLKFYIQLLKAQTYKTANKCSEAKECLIKAIQLGQEENYIRLFIDEGDKIKDLLDEIWKETKTKNSESLDSISIEYLNQLMSSLELERKRIHLQTEHDLSSRELDTLKLIAQNLSNKEIADQLYISITTVKTHVRNILSKIGAKNRTDAVYKAKEKSII